MSEKEVRNIILVKKYEYQFSLIARRWQSFLAYLVVNGLLLNAMSSFLDKMKINESEFSMYAVSLSITGIIMANVFIRCVSIMSERVVATQLELENDKYELVVHVPPKSSPDLSITSMLYIAIIILAAPWFIFIFSNTAGDQVAVNWLMSGLIVIITLVNLGTVTWRVGVNKNQA